MIRLLVHLHVRLPIPSIAICSTPVPLSQLHTQIHTQWPPLLPKQNFPRSKCPTEENTDKQQSCVHSQTTTSPSQEFIRIPIVKTFVSLSSFSIIQIRHNAQLTPFCHTHKWTAVVRKLSARGSPAWCSMPYWHLMFRSQLGGAIIQTQGWTASLILRGVHVAGGMAAGLCGWVADSCMITRCSLRSDKIKQGRKTRREEWWGWSSSGSGKGSRREGANKAKKNNKKKKLRGEFKLSVSLIMKRHLKIHMVMYHSTTLGISRWEKKKNLTLATVGRIIQILCAVSCILDLFGKVFRLCCC